MSCPTLGLYLATLAAAPSAEAETSAEGAPTSDEAPQLVEDMPDPHAEEWEPPPGPTRPPPQTPATTPRAQAPQASAPRSRSAEPPPSSGGSSTPTNAAKHGRRLQVAGLVFGGAGIIGVAVGGYMFDQARQTKAELDAEQALLELGFSTPADVAEIEAKLAEQRTIMTIGLIAGGSSLGVAAILFITGTVTKQRAAAPTVSISGGPQLVGVTVSGRF